MQNIQFYKIAKIGIYVFFVYILWYIYLFGEKLIFLYSSVLIATLCILSEIFRDNADIRLFCPYGVLLNIIMCIYSLLTGVFSARNSTILIDNVKTYACFSVVCFDICYVTKKEGSIKWLLDIFIIICAVSSVNILINGTFVSGYGYVLGPKQNPNLLGLTMDLGIFSAAFNAMKTKEKKVFYISMALLFLYTIIQCGSRKCLISAVIICILWFAAFAQQMWKKGIRHKISVVFLVGILVIAVWYYYNNVYVNTYSYNRMEILGSTVSGSSSQIRTMYYRYAVNYFMEQPVFGIGLGQFAVWNPLHGYSHSTYAEALADWGFVGCIIYFYPAIAIGIKLLQAAFSGKDAEVTRIIIALWAMEMFMGVGQIWFYEIEHLLAWTLIYLYYDMYSDGTKKQQERTYKYVKA